MKRTLLVLALTALLAPAMPVAAQQGDEVVTHYEFMDDLVTGDRYTDQGIRLSVRPGASRGSLIRARAHWIPELMKTVENL